ncbi:MAG TPA: hypothetical protein VGD62_08375 [Acidobacteriaceae bacterium]
MLRISLRYALPLLALGFLTLGFLRRRRFAPLGSRSQLALTVVAALPLVVSGTLHLLRPAAFLPLLPPWVPRPALVIVLTGLPELAGAAGLFFPAIRRSAAASLAVFMIAVFPANIYVAGQRVHGLSMPGIPARIALQAAYILLLLTVGYGVPRLDSGLPSTTDLS